MSEYALRGPDERNEVWVMFLESAQNLMKQLMNMGITDYLDIILVACLIYRGMNLIRSTNTMRVVKVVAVILVVAWLTEIAHLYTISFLLGQIMQVGLIALVVLFQPELRRMMDQLGNMSLKRLLGEKETVEQMDLVIAETVRACEVMSREKIGALIVFARQQRLDEFFSTGTVINGKVSEQLIRNIFFPKAALHDGAMIIRDGEITAAGCVLPLSDSSRLSADLGTRHRAGVGMSENSDAVVVIVSEETGTISVAVGGMLKRHLASQTLQKLLQNELCPKDAQEEKTGALIRLKQRLTKEGGKNEE